MKKTVLTLLFVGGLASAAPLTLDSWDMNPLTWKIDAAKGQVAVTRPGGLALAPVTRCTRLQVSARVTPVRSGTNNWSTLGVAFVDDEQNFWHAALVQAPASAQQGRRFFELSEMRNGHWLAHFDDKLVCTRSRQTQIWNYGENYDVTLTVENGEVRGTVRNAKGTLIWEHAFAFPKPTPDGTVNAVTCGRPALHATGDFIGSFAQLDATTADPRPQPAAPRAFPPYTGTSYVQDVTERATGFFRVAEKDGRWWVIDPLGRGTVLCGIDHVTYWGHHSQRTGKSHHLDANKRRFPNKKDWETATLNRLTDWGFNLLGAGCDAALARRGLIHTIFLSIGDHLCWDGNDPEYYICPNEHRPCSAFPNVFHPDFPRWADYIARTRCAPNRNDPWLFGYFIDNELAWWGRGTHATGLFDAVAKLPETHSARIAQRRFLVQRGITGSVPDSVKLDFLRLAADIYFRESGAAIRRHDPNHLVLGARFAGLYGAHVAVWEIAGTYCDIVTFNCYPWADLDRNVVLLDRGAQAKTVADAFTERYVRVKRPMLVTEWSFPALDSGLPCTGGAGQRFQTQALRTQATELFAKTMLALPFMLGYDYFMWVDEPPEGISDAFPEDSNYGLIQENGDAYPEITAMFKRLQRDAGTWRRTPVPAARPATRPRGLTAGAYRAQHFPDLLESTTPTYTRVGQNGSWSSSNSSGDRLLTYSREGDAYTFSNAAGLELAGRIGGAYMFTSVKLNGRTLGTYTGMWNDRINGELRWHDAGHVVSADWHPTNGLHVVRITCESRVSKTRGLRMTHDLTLSPDRPWFLCELVSATNIGTEPIEMNAFYFREYAPFATDKYTNKIKSVPNLWQAPSCDFWLSKDDGFFYGGYTCAPTVKMFSYLLMENGTSQHPDAMFVPHEPLTLQPNATFRPNGDIWMLAICGQGGQAGWQQIERLLTGRK